MKRTLWIALALVLLVACTIRPVEMASIQTSANLLQNPGFEGEYVEQDVAPELKVAAGWNAWWDARDSRPEYKAATLENTQNGMPRIREGDQAQQWFNSYRTHTAGVRQVVFDLTPGTELTFSAWVQAFSSNEDHFWESAGKYRFKIGIDPYGGLDWEGPDVAWSNDGHAIEPYDRYQQLEVSTVARSDRCTVFVWGQAEWPLKHNNAYVDDAALVQSGTVSTPTPWPTPTSAVTPGATPPPAATVDYDEIERRVLKVLQEWDRR